MAVMGWHAATGHEGIRFTEEEERALDKLQHQTDRAWRKLRKACQEEAPADQREQAKLAWWQACDTATTYRRVLCQSAEWVGTV